MEGLPISNQLSIPATVTQIIAGENITIDQPNGNVTINAPGAGPGGGVLTLAGLEGVITLSSPDSAIVIDVAGQDIQFSSNGVRTATAGDGITIDGTNDITITNTGVLSISDATGLITLSGGTGVDVTNESGTFTISNTGVTELTGGAGIGLNFQTGSVTISNLGLLSAVAGDGIGVATDAGAATISNTGVTSLAGLAGNLGVGAGTGIGVTTSGSNVIISNTGITSLTPGTGIGVSGSTITNNGVRTIADLSGAITLSASGMTITPSGQNLSFSVPASVSSLNTQTGVLAITGEAGMGVTGTPGTIGLVNIARSFTLTGTTIGGNITYSKPSGAGNTWTVTTWTLANTIEINVPPAWQAGQSVGFDGYEYLNWDSNTASYFAIYYVTTSHSTEQSLIGTTTPAAFTDAIYGGNAGQAYLPMNLTIPPTYLQAGGTITLRIYGLLTSAGRYLANDPTIDARVSIVYP